MSPSLRVLSLIAAGGDVGESCTDDVETFMQLCVGDCQRHESADHVVLSAGAKQNQSTLASESEDLRCLGVCRRLLFSIADELQARHRAHDPDVANQLELGFPASHAFFNDRSDPGGTLGKPLV